MEKLDLKIESADREEYVLFFCSNHKTYVMSTNDVELQMNIVCLLRDAADFVEGMYLKKK